MCLCGDMFTGMIHAWCEGQPDRYRDLSHNKELLTCFLVSPKEHQPRPLTPSMARFLLSIFYANIRPEPCQLLTQFRACRVLTNIVYG